MGKEAARGVRSVVDEQIWQGRSYAVVGYLRRSCRRWNMSRGGWQILKVDSGDVISADVCQSAVVGK